MSNYIKSVDEFHVAFNHPRNEVADAIPQKVRKQRVNLIFEENKELAEASDVRANFQSLCLKALFGEKKDEVESLLKEKGLLPELKDGDNVDKKEELDALCDIQYVLSGAIISLGHYANFDKAFDDVHTSNMSKMCATLKEVDDTIKFHTTKEDDRVGEDDIKYTKKGDKYIVYRVSDDKVLKNVHYKAVDLTQYV